MKKHSRIATILVVVVLSMYIIKDIYNKVTEETVVSTEETNKMEVILNNIFTRSSVRSYTNQEVESWKLELLLKAGMASPTAGNKQPWAFIVVNSKELLQNIADTLEYGKMVAGAPLAIVVCGDTSKVGEGKRGEYWIQDCSAVTENILLAAHGMDLGAVWVSLYPMDDRVGAVKEMLALPENIIPFNVIPVGYPKGEATVKQKWNPDIVKYNNW